MNGRIPTLIMKSFPLMLQGMILTIKISIASLAVGFIVGIVLGLANSKRLRLPVVGMCIDLYTTIIRGTPIYVQILLVYFALPDLIGVNLTPFTAGVLALGANSVAYVSEIVRAGVNSIPAGQWDAAYVLGYSTPVTLLFIIMPQMFRNILPALTNELVTLIKETSLLSSIGLVELTRVSRNIIARELDPMTIYLTAAVFYLVLTTAVTLVANRIEQGLSHD